MAVRHGGNIFTAASEARIAWQQVLDFSASINPLGPSPVAREAMLAALDRVVHYPEPTAAALRAKLAEQWDMPPDRLLMGAGATELLFDWCRWAGPGTIAAPAFGEFHRAWPEARVCRVDDPATWPAAGPLVITRPANPTGTLIEADVIRRFASDRNDAVLVDESFIDFCDAESLVPSARGNLFVLRSLTKFWALPGLRIGALAGDVEPLAQRRGPWAVSTIAEAAALASLADAPHFERSRAWVRAEGDWMAAQLRALPGITVEPPTANFLFCEVVRAAELVRFARDRHVLLRDCSRWPGVPQNALRVAVRPRWENEILLSVCKEFLCA